VTAAPFRAEHIGSLLRPAEDPLTPADQEARLRLVVETAGRVWG
jgi:hypothetical protein